MIVYVLPGDWGAVSVVHVLYIELERGIGELLKVFDHSCSFGVLIDIPDTGQIVFVGVDDAGTVAIPPEMS